MLLLFFAFVMVFHKPESTGILWEKKQNTEMQAKITSTVIEIAAAEGASAILLI